jgi:hypothetical protein
MEEKREAGMMTTSGVQGVGKTYQNMYVIKDYTKDKFYNKVPGRRCLIFDTNGEYTGDQFARADIQGYDPRRISLSDVPAWSRNGPIECRRVDGKNASIQEKKQALEFLLKNYIDGMLVIEDINTYILNMTHMEEIVGGLVNLRHRAVDVLISYQSLRPVEPRIWQNSRWVRMHYQADNVNDIKNKVTNPQLFKISQLIVNNRYFSGDKRFFVYIHNFANQVEGQFTKQEFEIACKQYLNANKKELKEHKEMYGLSQEEAVNHMVAQLVTQYYKA